MLESKTCLFIVALFCWEMNVTWWWIHSMGRLSRPQGCGGGALILGRYLGSCARCSGCFLRSSWTFLRMSPRPHPGTFWRHRPHQPRRLHRQLLLLLLLLLLQQLLVSAHVYLTVGWLEAEDNEGIVVEVVNGLALVHVGGRNGHPTRQQLTSSAVLSSDQLRHPERVGRRPRVQPGWKCKTINPSTGPDLRQQ